MWIQGIWPLKELPVIQIAASKGGEVTVMGIFNSWVFQSAGEGYLLCEKSTQIGDFQVVAEIRQSMKHFSHHEKKISKH